MCCVSPISSLVILVCQSVVIKENVCVRVSLLFFFFFLFLIKQLPTKMPILEISSAQAPKDLNTFTKKMNALFAELIGKPESVIITLISGINRFC